MLKKTSYFLDRRQNETLPCHIHISLCPWIMNLDTRGKEKNPGFEMRCYGRLLVISCKDHVIYMDFRRKIQEQIFFLTPISGKREKKRLRRKYFDYEMTLLLFIVHILNDIKTPNSSLLNASDFKCTNVMWIFTPNDLFCQVSSVRAFVKSDQYSINDIS